MKLAFLPLKLKTRTEAFSAKFLLKTIKQAKSLCTSRDTMF